MKLSHTEENYLKAIYKTLEREGGKASTNSIAEIVNTTPASVSDMIKKLTEKGLLKYEKYQGVQFSKKGKSISTELIRKHRLWETFLATTLNFSWDQVHQIADQMDHVQSEALIDRLDAFLNYPKFDPHGEPIPNKNGKITLRNHIALNALKISERGKLIGIKAGDNKLFKYLSSLEITLGSRIQVLEQLDYDHSIKILIDENKTIIIPATISDKLMMNRI